MDGKRVLGEKGDNKNGGYENKMKKYLLLIEDEKVWEKFKEGIDKDINSEIIELIKKKVEVKNVKR